MGMGDVFPGLRAKPANSLPLRTAIITKPKFSGYGQMCLKPIQLAFEFGSHPPGD